MVRTQVQISEEQVEQLRRVSAAQHVSMAEVIRVSIDFYMEATAGGKDKVEQAKSVAGRFGSGSADGSREHDAHLAEAYSGL